MKPRLFIAAVLLMAGVLDFSAILAMMTFDSRDRDALLERYNLPSKHLQLNLQHAVDYGLRLDSAVGIKRDLVRTRDVLLEEAATLDARLTERAVVEPILLLLSPEGDILYGVGDKALSDRLPDDSAGLSISHKAQLERSKKKFYAKWNGHYVISLGIFSEKEETVASLVTILDAGAIDDRVSTTVTKCFQALCAFVLLAIIAYVLSLWWALPRRPEEGVC